jgi:magnesium transporter
MAETASSSLPASASQPGIVAAGVYLQGRRVADIEIEQAGEWARRPGHVVWIGLFEPAPDVLRRVQVQFGLHDLAIEDAETAHQQPKVEQYGESLFIVARTAQMVEGSIAFGETHLFVGKGYIVSVRHGASTPYSAVRQRTEACPIVLANGEDYILYAILDFIVDNYFPVVENIQAEVEALEDKVLAGALSQSEIQHLYMMRRDLLRLRNAVAPLVDVCRRLEHAEVKALDASVQPLYRDVSDHIGRVQEKIDSLREVVAFAFEASLMTGQAQQAEITRQLAAWAAILAVPTAIAGVYGMNFQNMPELEWRFGYPVALGTIATICGVLYWRFHKSGWL